jgi:2-polyprenyl-3-methyl-5-hydroxy-6-metoxy-1,4-benzoquinol methylase
MSIEDYETQESFDVVTMKMVVEHIRHPSRVVTALARLVKPSGKVVIFAPNRFSPISIGATLVPSSLLT